MVTAKADLTGYTGRKEYGMKKKFRKYYVSLYELYPIYEPAEGGYYYDGCEYKGSLYECKSLKKARWLLKKEISYLQEEYGEDSVYKWGLGVRTQSKYIGDGEIIRIETRKASGESGYKPYC